MKLTIPKPVSLVPLLVALLVGGLVACDDDDPLSPPLDAQMRWILEDGCSDGLGLQARLFDISFDRVYPSNSEVYFTDPGDAIDVTIQCPRNAQVCYGASTDPETDFFWGIGLDGLEGCDDCCEVCTDQEVEFLLTCGAKRLKSSARDAVAAPVATSDAG